jgi:alpha-glucosidase
MRIAVLVAFALLLSGLTRTASAQKEKVYNVVSPGGKTKVSVAIGAAGLSWSLSHGGQEVLAPSAIALGVGLDGEILDGRSIPVKTATLTADEWIVPLHYKKDSVRNRYSQLTLSFPRARYEVVFRAYDDGAAYRWVTSRKDSLTIRAEKAEFNFPADDKAWIPYVNDPSPDIWTTSFENLYRTMRLSEFKRDTLARARRAVCAVSAGVAVGRS